MHVPFAARSSIGRPALLLGLAFVVGTGIGWVATRPFAPSSHQVTTADYVTVVAQLFQRDHNEEVARERLALLGSPSVLVEEALRETRAGKVQDPSDRDALQSLAQAVAPSAVATTSASKAASTDQTTTATTAPNSVNGAPSSDDRGSWLGPIIAFLSAFALGTLVLLRTAGLSVPLPGISRGLSGGLTKARLPERKTSSRHVAATLRTGPTPIRRARNLDVSHSGETAIDDDEDDDSDRETIEAPVVERSVARNATLVRPRPAVARPANVLSFQSCYRLGDDPYDEIHPITDPTTGALVAACGLSASLKLDSSTDARYDGFTAWLQDYVSGQELRSVGLVTRWGYEANSARIDRWVRDGEIEEVIPVHPGSTASLQTGTVTTEITVTEVAHGDGDASGKFFAGLTVRFDVRWAADDGN